MKIPFVGGAYEERSLALNSSVCQNLYLEVDQGEGKEVLSLVGTPGLLPWDFSQSGGMQMSGTVTAVKV